MFLRMDWLCSKNCNGPNGDPNFHNGIQLNPYNQPWMLLNSTMIDLYLLHAIHTS